ncbi:MAG: CsbD family protein [Caldilineaceae bacterium]|nr:CsbD family protein [Caldilineaceae bacterium]
MNDDVLKGKWRQFKGSIQERWGELTDDELDQINGEREQMIGKLQEKYGYARDKAEAEYNDFVHTMGDKVK